MRYEKNNNAKVIGKLAKKSIRASKMRNAFIVVTIVLSVSLLMAMSLFTTALTTANKRSMEKVQHVIYYNLNETQLDHLKKDDRISYMTLGKRGQAVEIDNYTLAPSYVDGSSTDIQTLNLLEGRLPEAQNEVLVTKEYLKQVGKTPEPGAAFSVTFLDGSTETFTASGLIEGPPSTKQYSLIFSKAYAENGLQLKNVPYEAYVRLVGAEQMGKEECQNQMYTIGGDAGIIRENMNSNNRFLDSLTINFQEVTLIVSVGLVVLIASILVIYGVFYISVVGHIRTYGQMRTIGMTRKQVRKLVNREGLFLFCIGAPIGLIIGTIIGYFVKPDGFSFVNTVIVAILVAFVNLITVMISIRKPALMAASISPIEASKYSAYKNRKQKKTKKEKRKITPIRLALMNSVRNRKKVIITVLSLGVGGILFMAAATFVNSFDQEMFSRQGDFKDSEYIISYSSNALDLSEYSLTELQKNAPLNETLKNKVLSIDGVDGIRSNKSTSVIYDYPKQDVIHKEDQMTPFTKEEANELEKYLEQGTFDYDALSKGDSILINGNDVAQEIYGWRFEVGDTLTFYFYNGDTVVPKEVKIAGMISKEYPKPISGWFMMSEEAAQAIIPFSLDKDIVISTGPSMESSVGESLQSLVDASPNLKLTSLQTQRENDAIVVGSLSATAMGLALFIIAFSLINLVNTLITNILSKKQELAMLESIGMSRKQVHKMVLYEGILLSIGNLLITLTLGTTAGYLVCVAFEKLGVHYMIYQFPTLYVLIYAAVLLLVPYIISKIALRNFEKHTLVERLREAE